MIVLTDIFCVVNALSGESYGQIWLDIEVRAIHSFVFDNYDDSCDL